jgi:Flp pilus assembly protein TadG
MKISSAGAGARWISDESGSAAIEFILFTIPLLVPLAIFLTTVTISSSLETDVTSYSRQLVRAYVTSPSDDVIPLRLAEVTSVFQEKIFSHDAVAELPTYSVYCSLQPCMSTGGSIKIEVTARNSQTHKDYVAQSTELVDQWR